MGVACREEANYPAAENESDNGSDYQQPRKNDKRYRIEIIHIEPKYNLLTGRGQDGIYRKSSNSKMPPAEDGGVWREFGNVKVLSLVGRIFQG